MLTKTRPQKRKEKLTARELSSLSFKALRGSKGKLSCLLDSHQICDDDYQYLKFLFYLSKTKDKILLLRSSQKHLSNYFYFLILTYLQDNCDHYFDEITIRVLLNDKNMRHELKLLIDLFYAIDKKKNKPLIIYFNFLLLLLDIKNKREYLKLSRHICAKQVLQYIY